ncbi:MAG: hypothetical protein GY801_42000, partial [bacterium]|nr:hypothetical protein [bacterium]
MKICTVIFILTLVVSLPVSGQVQLDSRQQKQLNDAEYYMNQAANDFQELTQLTRGLEAAPDISVISLNKLKEEMAKFGYTRQKLQNVESRLQNLPADLQIVGEMAAAAAGFRQRLDADEQVFAAIQAKLESIQDINNWPDFKTDLETLEGMTSMFSTSSMLTQYPDRAVKALEQWEQIQTFFHGLQKYQPLINQQSAEGRQIQQAVNNHSLKITAFQEEARKFIDAVPGEIDRYLKLADEMAEDAVKNTKPLLFQGGVAQQLKLADDRVRVLGVLTQKYDPTLYNTQKKKLDDAKSKLAHMQASLKDAIIASNQA